MTRFTRMYDFFKLFVVLFAIASLISASLISCGGGGGGGGGAASGPSGGGSSSASGSSGGSTPAAAPVLSSNAEILSFSFKLADNPTLAARFDTNLDGNAVSADDAGTVTVSYPYGTLTSDDLTALKPTIEVSAGASITPNSGAEQDFSSNVVYTVKAQDGTEKVWTVSVTELSATERKINYVLNGGVMKVGVPSFKVEDGADLPGGSDVVKDNYYFTGWTDQSTGSAITGWTSGVKTEDVTVTANWSPAPYVKDHNIYANGLNVTVKKNSNKTMVYFRENNSINGNEIALSAINAAEEYQDLTGYSLFAGGIGNINNTDIPTTDCTITMTDGTLSNIYGYNGNKTNLIGNVFIQLNGGSVTNDVKGFVKGAPNQPANVAVNVSGNPTVGNKTDKGIWLNSLTSQIVTINDSLTANAEAITLIADHSHISEDTVIATFTGGTADAGKFKLLRDDTHATVNVNASGNDIVTIGSFGLPDRVTWTGTDEFTVGTGNVNTGGTIFSVFVDGGYLTVTETTRTGAKFDMGIPLGENNKENGYDNTLYENKKYRYIQFTSEAGDITAKNADTFLSKIHFHTINGASVKVRINLETVPITGTGYKLNENIFYLDGSFYKKSEHFDKGAITWPQAYNKAKEDTFNGLKGYLMTITSDAENKFVYDQLFKGMEPDKVGSWIGGTRLIPKGGYDKSTWEKESCGDKWVWASGPEAGKVFYENTIYRSDDTTNGTKFIGKVINSKKQEVDVSGMNYRAEGMYSSWSNPVDCALNGIDWYYDGSNPKANSQKDFEPNNGPADNYTKNPPDLSDKEVYTDYTGRYVWNDTAEGKGSQDRWQVHYYIVEFTPYEPTAYGPGQKAIKTALHAERVYTKN